MHDHDHLRLTREELYDLVWAKPMTQVAKDYEISDRAMAKVCARKQVPVPPRGYWAKKNANKKVAKPPLPAFVAKAPKEKTQNEQAKVDQKEHAAGKRKAKIHSVFEDRDREIKKKLKEFRKSLSEGLYYTVRVTGWNSDYSFGLNSSYDPLRKYDEISFLYEHPFDDYRALLIKGDILEPRQLKGQKIEANFTPRSYLNPKYLEENQHRYEEALPKFIGRFQKNNNHIGAYISVPEDAFNHLLQNAAAGKINFLSFHGEKMRYRHGHVFRISFQEKRDDEDNSE